MLFDQLDIIEPILRALKQENYTQPTPIQQQSIPHTLKGRDLLGCAQTGTGKTAAFAIPIIQQFATDTNIQPGIKCLILSPTRELAIQIDESFSAYSRYTNVTHTVVFGGVSQVPQVKAIHRKPDVLIATPGRLLDLIQQGIVNLQHIKVFVLDEADRMLDMGFIHDVKKIISRLPEKRQTMFFSATMPPEIQHLVSTLLKNPIKVEVTPPASTVDKIQQQIYFTDKMQKQQLLIHLLEEKSIKNALVFTRTKHGANKIVKFLDKCRIKSAAIHGNKSQTARQNALNDFKQGNIRILVATDIAARGIDIDELSYVFNFDLPNIPETYVHRIGRTGRAGHSGIAISFCDKEEVAFLRDIQKLISRKIPVIDSHPFVMN
jgi:ATP-dependent RNA helicase RhlE